MSEEVRFLTGLAQAVSAMRLYEEQHPARERAIDEAYDRLQALAAVDASPEFTFMEGEILYGRRPLRDLSNWDWSHRLASVGIGRLKILGEVDRDELEGFLDDALTRLTGGGVPTAEIRQMKDANLRYGPLVLKGMGDAGATEEAPVATLAYTLREEAEGVQWLHEELRDRNELHLVEAEAVVRSLSVAMHGHQEYLIPLLKLKRFDQYTTTHAMNVGVLSMALAEFIGLGPREVRSFGVAGLLHDLGKVKIPEEILNKSGKLTEEERRTMNQHPAAGARIILETERNMDLAAVVAYEHHIMLDGGGYPSLSYPRDCHRASNLVHVCDVFDALRTRRPYREAWERSRVLDYLEERSGKEFDPELTRAFVQMIRTRASRIALMEGEDQDISSPDVVEGPLPGSAEGEAGASGAPDSAPTHGSASAQTPAPGSDGGRSGPSGSGNGTPEPYRGERGTEGDAPGATGS